MEIEDYECVSIDDGGVCSGDTGTNFWNTVLGPTDEEIVTLEVPHHMTVDHDEETPYQSIEKENEEEETKEPMSFELQQGYRILRELMAESNKSVNWHFLEAVDDSYPETKDYYDRIKSPMWLRKMNAKFHERQYESITEFVADFRLMLENCFRYNGPDHYVSKRGQRLETMLEQKLALLSRDLREKTSIAATSGKSSDESFSAAGLRRRVKSIIPHDSSALLNHLREEELRQQREQRRQVIADRKAAQEAYLSNLQEWEDQLMGTPEHQMQLKAMWELPAIGHFLFLCQETLNLEEVAQYELERCFMMPRQSSTMQRVMSSLLSTPFQRFKLDKKTMMPYYVWEEKLRKRLDIWYKMLDDSRSNIYKVAYKLGIDAFFFDVVGKKNPLIKKKFHELSFYRRVWIVKSICDNCVESQESLRDTIEAQQVEEQRSYVLGQDGKGNTYIHFPQFCGADLRVYRQDPHPEPDFCSSNEEEDEDTPKTDDNDDEEDEVSTPPVKKRRVGRSALSGDSRQTPTNRRSSRRREKPSDMEDTEPENTPSEVSTEPGSRSLTATPEIVDELEEEVLTARRTRSGRSKRSLYQNGLTRELERSLRKLRRTRVNDQRSEMDDSPNVASDSDRDASIANDNHNNNNCANVQSDVDLVDGSQLKSDTVKVERDDTSESESIIKPECDNLVENETEDVCDVYRVKSKGKDNDLCKQSDMADVKHCNGDSQSVTSAITNGDISNGQVDSAAKSGYTGKHKGKLKEGEGGSEGKEGEGGPEEGGQSDEQEVIVKQEAAIAESTSAQIVENGAGSEQMDTTGSAGLDIKVKTEAGDTEELTVVKNEDDSEEDSKPDLQSGLSADDSQMEADADSGKVDADADEAMLNKVKTENGSVKSEDGLKIPKTEPVEEEEESEDELTPEIGQFELVADSVEDLRLLTEKFAEPTEPPPPVTTRGKKSKSCRASTRKRCEVDLYERLAYLLKELEPWEPKLVQARRKAQVKMRKELDEYKEEEVKPDVDWNTEDSSSDEEAEAEGGCTMVKEEEGLESKVKKSSHPPSVVSTDSRDSLLNNQDDEYEIDVSSRGRLRKRRVIPNNIEDQGIKKKKVAKPGEEISVHLPNILQKQLKPSTGITLSAGNTNATTTMHNMSASQILRMSILNQSQGKTSLIPSSVSNIRLASVGTGVSVTQSSHPVIQSLLTTRGQPITQTGLRQVRPKPVMMTSLKAPTSGAGMTSSPGKATLEVTGGNTPSSTQKILNSLPASVIQQLLKHKAIKIQTTGPGGTTLFLTSAVPTSSAITSTSQQTTTASPVVPQLAVQSSVHPETPVSSIAVASVKTEGVALASVSSQPQLQPVQSAAALLASQLNIVTSPTSSVVTPSQTALGSVPSTATQNPVIIPIQGSNHTSPSSANVSPLQATETSHSDVIHRPYIFPAGYSPPPKHQKYASNVTVKALLESRANMKTPDPSTGLTRADMIENILSVSATKDGSSILSNVILSKVAGSPSPGQFKPRVLKLPSQEALDNALQSVVTSVSTSLPTANIKVPSAVTLPSIQPRRNVTKTIQSMKAPIPVTHKVGSTPPSTLTSPSNLTQSASKSTISSLTQVTKSPLKTGFVVQTPTSGSGSGQKNMLLKVVPQNFLTSQGLVQGYLTPQGLVIPQNKQTVVSAAVPSTSNANVTFTSPNLIKDTPNQAKQVIVTQAPKQIQLSFSPVKQAVASSNVPQITPVVDLQQINKGLTKISTPEVIPQPSPSQSQASLTSATQTTASKLSKGMKPSQIQTKVATPAAELVKQIAAGQSSIHGTRMMVPSANQLLQGKLATGLSALRTPVSGAQASVIPALMVGQPAVASSPLSPRLILPPQPLTGTPLLPIKTVGTTSEPANKPSVVPTSLQLAGKSPSTPFVLSLGSGLQNVILSPNKDLTSQPISQLQAPSLQLSIPQTVVKTTAVTPNVASLQLPVQSMPLNQQVLKLTPQQLASGLVSPQTGTGVVQLIQQQVSGATPAAAPKQVLISPQQVGALNMAVAPGVKVIAQQPGTSTIPALINKAAPQVLQQKMTALQVASTSRQGDGKAPVILQQQVLPLSAGTPGQIVQVGQQQLLINKSIPQQSIVASQTLPGGLVQPSAIRVLQAGGTLQQSPVMQLQGNVSVANVPQAPVTPVTAVQCSTVRPSMQIASPGTLQTAAAQPATKAALQAHLNQTKQTVLVPGSKAEMPTLSTILGHEKGKVITSLNTANLTPQKQAVKATDNQISLSNLNAVQTAANVSVAVPQGTSADSGSAEGQTGKQQKLLLYNIGGQLMTAQGVPVTVEQGVLKVIPQATIQIGNQMLTIKSPSSAMVENPSGAKTVASTAASITGSTAVSESISTTADVKSAVASVPSSGSNILIQANIQSAAGFTPNIVKTKTSPEPKLHKTDLATNMPYFTKRVATNSADLLTPIPSDPSKPVITTPTIVTASLANSVSSNQMIELANKVSVVTQQTKATDASKPVLQKTGSREEAALNLLSLANISER